MSRIRTQNEIISNLLDFFRVAQPSLDTKPGTVARDLAIEGLSLQLARLYDELNRVSTLQSLRLALGVDLDRLASNFGIVRGRGGKSTGPGVICFNSLDADISLNKGDIITARNGSNFLITSNLTISSVLATSYKATASRIRSDLDYIGITDQYAVEVLLQASSAGIQGNISKFSLSSTSISGVSNVTNLSGFGGGRAAEDDASFRSRILAVFSGANTGTALGYKNAVRTDPSVKDAIVIEPGDSLMTRDGTQVNIDSNENRTVISEGSGGKVDVIVLGISLADAINSYIYRDLSNTGDPTNANNDYVIGQIIGDEDKTVTRKRLDNLASGVLPNQPVNNIVQVSGSVSGGNFAEEVVDELGRSTGNYRLVRDTGAYAGSPWGFDKLHWIDDNIRDLPEDKTKQSFNGQDTLGFSDVTEITSVTQNITISNENSRVDSSNRSSIQLSHFPITNVTRVFNATTGERYVVANQNPDGTGTINKTGRILISGKSLPTVSQTLQIDYTWVFSFDGNFDYDNKTTNSNPRTVQDSIDWGFSNVVRREPATLVANGSFLSVTTAHPISEVITVNIYESETSAVSLSSSRLAVVVTNSIENVVSVVRSSDGAELWNTSKLDGSFSGLTLFLPTDTSAEFQDEVSVVYNAEDVYNADIPGSFSGTTITVVENSPDVVVGTLVECTYIANVSAILPSTVLAAMPALRSGNNFTTAASSTLVGNQPTTHLFSSPGVVSANLRQAPSNLALTIAGSISPGIITVSGTSITGVFESVFTVANAGLKQDLSSALRATLGLSSKTAIPANIRIARISKVEKVTTTSAFEVLTVDHEYDVRGYKLLDNTYVKSECVSDSSLTRTEFRLPATSDNEDESPTTGERLRVTFYYTTASDSENVSFSKSGTLYTNKRFTFVDSIAKSSGFTSTASDSATLTVGNLNQPASKSRYKTTYDYIAPKVNERITIRFRYDQLITAATLAIESTRPINADVLAKSSVPIDVDVTIKITVTEDFTNSSTIVIQNVQDAITSALNATALGTKVDGSDLINQSYTVSGIDSARITYFNRAGRTGSVLSITAQKNEYIRANNVTIELE